MPPKQLSEEIPNLPTRIKGEILPPAPDPMTVARLLVVKGNEEGCEYFIKKGVTGIGRATDNEIALTDLSCSRKHVQLIWEDESLTLADLGGGNGTVLNKHRVTRTTLRNNDVFEIGNTQFKVELYALFEESAAPVAAPRKAPEPKKPSAAVAQNQTVGLPGLQAGMVGGVLPPTVTGGQNLPGPFGGAKPTMLEEAAPAPARLSAPTLAASAESLMAAPPPVAAPAPTPAPVAAPVMTPAPVDAPAVYAGSPTSGGLLQKLSGVGQQRGKSWVYALAGGNAVAFLLGGALLFSGSGASASGVKRFEEGVAAYSKMDWTGAETAFQDSLSQSPTLNEAADYLRLTKNEQANAERLSTAKSLLTQPMIDSKTAVIALSLAVSVPMESASGGEAKQLAHQAKQALSASAKMNIEGQLQQSNPMSFQAAAFELNQVEAAYGGKLPASFMRLAEQLQKSAMQSDWHVLLTQPAIAMAEPTPMPIPAVMPEPTKPEPVAMVMPEPAKPEPMPMKPEPVKPEPMKAEPAKPEPVKPEPVKPAPVKPEPTAVAKTDPAKTATPVTPKESTKLDEKTAKTNAQSLYKEGKFAQAANEAKKNKKTEGLGKNIETFENKYGSAKEKYAKGERATIYDTVKSALSLDSAISGGFYADKLKPMLGPCADARAKQLYDEGNKAPTNYEKLRDAYSVAKDAKNNGVTKQSGSIITSLEADSKKKLAAAKAAAGKGKLSDALSYYDAVMKMMPTNTADYAEAKREYDKIKTQQGGL